MPFPSRSHDPGRSRGQKTPGKRRARPAAAEDEACDETEATFFDFTPEELSELGSAPSVEARNSIEAWASALWSADYRPWFAAESAEFADETATVGSVFPRSSYHSRLSEPQRAEYEAREVRLRDPNPRAFAPAEHLGGPSPRLLVAHRAHASFHTSVHTSIHTPLHTSVFHATMHRYDTACAFRRRTACAMWLRTRGAPGTSARGASPLSRGPART